MKKKIEYNIDLYEGDKDNKRFILGTKGEKPLFVIGVNPSYADEKIPDLTIKKVIGFSERNGNDSFIMLNLYAQRSTNPNSMHNSINKELHETNIKHILDILKKHKEVKILAAWGGTIKKRKYLLDCLKDIKECIKPFNVEWLEIENVRVTLGKQHPRHPSRGTYSKLIPFNIDEYLLTQ